VLHPTVSQRGPEINAPCVDEFETPAASKEWTSLRRKGATVRDLITCLWFDTEGEDAARFYTSVIPNSRILGVTRYGSAGPRREGTVMTVDFELNGQKFVALNGGPQFTHTEAFSLQVICEDQEEVDHYWATLSEAGEEGACGWVKDRFGLSWQIVPAVLPELLSQPDQERAQRVMQAMLDMRKLDIGELERAAVAA
jgi:predicted 3-demethylubiquinone-9 3-methyltransferase (glyoxalase superfamily)